MGSVKYFGENPLISTFQISIAEFISSGHFNGFDEETTTGGLLGAFGATAPWCAAYYGINPDFGWIRYPKSGGSTISESATGSDFAILLRVGNNIARLAVFQAKKVDRISDNFYVHQISPTVTDKDSVPEPQFLRLRDYGEKILRTLGRNDFSLPKMDWIHYLAYRRDSLTCIPISDLSQIDLIYQSMRAAAMTGYKKAYIDAAKTEKAANRDPDKTLDSAFRISLMGKQWSKHGIKGISDSANRKHLATLMTYGASDMMKTPTGWLEVSTSEEAASIVEAIRAQMDVYESIGIKGPKPTLEAEFNKWLSAKIHRKSDLKNKFSTEVNRELANADVAAKLPGPKPRPPRPR
ncbi:hypothetical protein ABFU52_13190 [Xanthomonas campestris pv. campestris]|uniref:hypothetical protein n=1 Tax=Xanthomonas campestris TaxID=339 RepID=UPI002B3CFA2F|nr:hypothetical protein [Xanthomonas campestris pv. campestris]MEB1310041.1 hypothetical protein [Xanthomonas campestris pv. campestris]MEB1335223.1 hypothetical protein [Xanthomonas campestris pv. campestris]